MLFVKGDLEISGCVNLNDIGIFRTGKVTISGDAKITGLIYAVAGLEICGTPDLRCIVIVNGLAEISGNVDSYGAISQKYTVWLKKND